MVGITEIASLAVTGTIAWFWHEKVLKDRIDTPRNNPEVKGLDKGERKAKIKELETEIKSDKAEIKTLDKERKECLNDENRKDEAQEKLEEKEEKEKELSKKEEDLKDLKIVEKGDYWAYAPNKWSGNNVAWVGGTIIGLIVMFKYVFVSTFSSFFNRPNQ